MADLEKSAMAEHHEQLDRVSTKDETASDDHKPLAPVETLVPVDIHNSQAFKGDESDGKIQWTIRKWFAAAFLAMLYTGKSPRRILKALSKPVLRQARKFFSISLVAHSAILLFRLATRMPSAGYQWRTRWRLHRSVRSLDTCRTSSESDTLHL